RLDEQIKLRGYRIELGEIEAALREHPEVGDAAVIVREDQPGDRRIVGYVVRANGADAELSTSSLPEALPPRLPRYMVPAALLTLDAIPMTKNGKVDRKALPAPELGRIDGSAIAPRTAVEEILCGIFGEVLGAVVEDVRASFFELGGHSLKATQL